MPLPLIVHALTWKICPAGAMTPAGKILACNSILKVLCVGAAPSAGQEHLSDLESPEGSVQGELA